MIHCEYNICLKTFNDLRKQKEYSDMFSTSKYIVNISWNNLCYYRAYFVINFSVQLHDTRFVRKIFQFPCWKWRIFRALDIRPTLKMRDTKITTCKNQLNEKFVDTTRICETARIAYIYELRRANLCTQKAEARNTWLLEVKLFRKLRAIRRYSRKVLDRRRELSYIKCKSWSNVSTEIMQIIVQKKVL